MLTGLGAGAAAGISSAAVLLLAVEPRIDAAIAIEEGNSGGHAHSHEAAAGAHDQGELVTRLQQQIGGAVTVIIVAALLGLAFAVVYARVRHRLPGSTEVGRSVALGVLGFTAFALAPALILPANPPAVGDPDTVNQRTAGYLLVILLTIVLTIAVFALIRSLAKRGVSSETRWVAGCLLGIVGAVAILILFPRVDTEIPHEVPAALIWEFRVSSLGQLAAMWGVLGLVHGVLAGRLHTSRSRRRASKPRPVAV
ncbi:CbtA family protein [Nocardioides sp. NPDC087217]|uniref:CbtA family protein n=1 Tax=Nocardioides sp. NPDC087217 TaxID=3364335 RepID=UPI0038144F4D